jgi:hypothetical protein
MSNFLTHDFKLPNYEKELYDAEAVLVKYKEKLLLLHNNKNIDDDTHTTMYDSIIMVLNYVGNLSTPSFNIQDDLKDLYILQYPHSPALAKQLFLEHYEQMHRPYNLLKNRCYRLLEELDAEYKKIHKKNPPNWKP